MLKFFGLCRWPGRIHGIGKMSYECYTGLLSVNFFSWNHILASSSADALKAEIIWAEGLIRKITCQVLGQMSCSLSIKVGKVILTREKIPIIHSFPTSHLSCLAPYLWADLNQTYESHPHPGNQVQCTFCESINALSKAKTICNYWCPDKTEYMTKGWGVSKSAILNFPVII